MEDTIRPVSCSDCPYFYECDNVGGFNDCKVAVSEKEDK